jgi:hypothetical protein
MSKARSDSVLDSLPSNQRETLERWLLEENLSIDAALDRLRLDFGVRSSRSAVGRFSQNAQQRRLLDKIAVNAGKANEISEAFEKNPAPVPQAVVKLVTQLAFEEITKGNQLDKEFIVKLTKLAVDSGLKAKKLELDERKVALLEAKAKQAEEAEKALGDSDLTPEQKQQRLRQIFGMS